MKTHVIAEVINYQFSKTNIQENLLDKHALVFFYDSTFSFYTVYYYKLAKDLYSGH